MTPRSDWKKPVNDLPRDCDQLAETIVNMREAHEQYEQFIAEQLRKVYSLKSFEFKHVSNPFIRLVA